MTTDFKSEYRRNLPHLQAEDRAVFVTFCTRDSWQIPVDLRDVVLTHCLHDHEKKLQMHGVVVMPDHVHLVFTPHNDRSGNPYAISLILKGIKGASARSINKHRETTGSIWQDESYDHVLRQDEDVRQTVEYVCQNPVRKDLVADVGDYPWLWREWIEGATQL